MTWVPNSGTAGYIGPLVTPAPLEDLAWEDFLHDVIAGITDLPNNLVRPRFQQKPPATPNKTVNWCAFGVIEVIPDWMPSITHVDTGDGYDKFERSEQSIILCSFYGPDCGKFAGLLRDGFFIDQNLAALRSAQVGLVEVRDPVLAPELFRQEYRDRTDLPVVLKRNILRHYPVLTLLRARGTITANDPGSRTIESGWDTDNI